MTAPDTSWMADAACRGRPTEWWFPETTAQGGPVSYKRARDICMTCPVRDLCDAYADLVNNYEEAKHGMFGGITPRRRTANRQAETPGLYGVRVCEVCGAEYEARCAPARYCDDTCRASGSRVKNRDIMRKLRAS